MSGELGIAWVRQQIEAHGLSSQQFASRVFQLLMSSTETDAVYADLLELFGFERTDLAGVIIRARDSIQQQEREKHINKRRRREQLRVQGNPALSGGARVKRGSDLPAPQRPFSSSSQPADIGQLQYSSTQQHQQQQHYQSKQQQQQQQAMSNNLFSSAGRQFAKFVYVQESKSSGDFLSRLAWVRNQAGKSVQDVEFPMGRVRLLSPPATKKPPQGSKGVLYWMSRDQRVQDNWALLFSQKLALEQKVPLHVCFCLVPKFLDATQRQYGFMLKGLQEVEQELHSLGIGFSLLLGAGGAAATVPGFVARHGVASVVTDFAPLRVPRQWVADVARSLPQHVQFFQVDTHNIVPCWEASDKAEEAAYLMRGQLQKHVHKYMTEFPPVIQHPYPVETEWTDWEAADRSLEIDRSVGEVGWATPGTRRGLGVLEGFVKERLQYYKVDRNIPTKDAVSNLSPWFHFGQVSVQRALLVANQYADEQKQNVDKFFHETLIWRELAENFCYYQPNYDNWKGCPEWARATWDAHRHDQRDYIYTRDQLEQAQTHDELWNAAQLQLVHDGKMHGFLRMYWAKKIMEWTEEPERALADAIYLNDKYNLDGRDPNGYGGCMWAICGVHDHEFAERRITGRIRCMTYFASTRKFDVPAFIRRYKKLGAGTGATAGPMDKFVVSGGGGDLRQGEGSQKGAKMSGPMDKFVVSGQSGERGDGSQKGWREGGKGRGRGRGKGKW